MNPLYLLLMFVSTGLISSYVGGPPLLTFAASAPGVVPLAGLVGEATEELAARTGPRVGGLLKATLGNAADHLVAVQMAAKDRMQLSLEISLDGESNWMEGARLLVVYVILAMAFSFLPA